VSFKSSSPRVCKSLESDGFKDHIDTLSECAGSQLGFLLFLFFFLFFSLFFFIIFTLGLFALFCS